MKNIGVILASGSGSRFGASQPKQFVKLAGKPVVQYTIEAFEQATCIDEIIIVAHFDFIDYIYELVNANLFSKVSKVIQGGKERYDSTLSALQSISEQEANVIIHDAVRPFISERIINDCVNKLERYQAVDVVVDAIDTIVKVDKDIIVDIPDRKFLKRGQTPQAFKKSVLAKAYSLFMQDENRFATDDCGVVLKYLPHIQITTVQGEESNFKLTHSQDMYLADNLIKDGFMKLAQKKLIDPKIILKGKTVLIFGASSGIGESLEILCREAGAITIPCSRSINNVNVNDTNAIKDIFISAKNEYKKIDYVVNTTGLLQRKPLLTMTQEEILESIQTNYISVITIARVAFNYLKETKGMLINFTSSSYTRGRANYSIYSSTKAAVVNFTQALAEEWQNHDVKINVINPERTATPMRTKNFGIEPESSLLSAKEVAFFTLEAMCSEHSGQVYTIKKDL